MAPLDGGAVTLFCCDHHFVPWMLKMFGGEHRSSWLGIMGFLVMSISWFMASWCFLGPQRTPGLTTNVLDMDDCHRKCHWRMEIRRITHRNHECPVGGFQAILVTPCRCLLWPQVSNGHNFRWLMIRNTGLGCFFSMEIMDQFDVANHSSPTSRFGNDRFPSYPHLLIQKAKDDPIEP